MFRKLHIYLKFIIAALVITNLYSQPDEIKFSHLTAEDGLSLNPVTEILQDSKGFLWFGTYNGLNRYDGYNFKVFLPDPLNPKSISNHSIWSLYEDYQGYIWIGTVDGLNRYDWRKDEFYRYKNDSADANSLSNNFIYSIFEDRAGTLWVGTVDGLNKYNRAKNNFTVYKNVSLEFNQNFSNSITCIEEDHLGNLWLGTWKGLTYFQKDGKMLYKELPAQTEFNTSMYNDINVIMEDNLHNLWIGTRGKGIYNYNPGTEKFINYYPDPNDLTSISDNFITSLYQDKFNNIWIGTRQGINKFNPVKKEFTRILHDPLKSSSLSHNEVLCIREDDTGIIWIGTAGGINKFHYKESKFNYYQEGNGSSNLSNDNVHSVFVAEDKNIWVGTEKGLNQIKPGKNSIIEYFHEPGNKNSLADNCVWSVIKDQLGFVWIGTETGLNRYNPATGEFKIYKYIEDDSLSLSNNGVISLCEDSNGNIWAGTWWGFNLFNREKETFTRYTDIFKNSTTWVIYSDSKGKTWFGSDGSGVSMYDPGSGTFTKFVHDSSSSNIICGNRIISMFESNDGIMWFGTTEGLSSYDRKTGKFKSYDKDDGLLSVLINGIQQDNKGNLWISTDKGLSKLNRKTGIINNYSKRNGLKEIEFTPNASGKLNNELIFGCRKGITFFNPDSIKDEYYDVPVVFTDLKIYNQSVPITKDGILKESISSAKEITIPNGNDVLTFEFALLDYFDVKRNSFKYKLTGFDIDWNDVGTRNNATYTNLPPGEYEFHVKALNSGGVRNEQEASLKIIIEPSFYQTIWFKLLFGFGILILTVLVFHIRTRAINNRNKMLEKRIMEHTKDLDKTISELSLEILERKKAEEKVQMSLKEKEVLLKEIHHRVKNNLQVISSLLYLNSKKIQDKEVLNMFIESQNRVKSIALVHERLYQSRDLGSIDFKEYVNRLTYDLFRSYALNQSVIRLDINIKDVFIDIDTAVPCGLIINELISNSFKYAFPNYEAEKKTGIIRIDFTRLNEKELSLVVSDNGVGMPGNINEKKNDSLGLQLVETLVAQLEGTISIDLTGGTSFIIKFKNSSV